MKKKIYNREKRKKKKENKKKKGKKKEENKTKRENRDDNLKCSLCFRWNKETRQNDSLKMKVLTGIS